MRAFRDIGSRARRAGVIAAGCLAVTTITAAAVPAGAGAPPVTCVYAGLGLLVGVAFQESR